MRLPLRSRSRRVASAGTIDRTRSRARQAHRCPAAGRVSFHQGFREIGLCAGRRAPGLWKVFVMERVSRAVVDGDLTAFVGWLQRETWLLGEGSVDFQDGTISAASLNDRGGIIAALFDLDPAILRRPPRGPRSKAIEWAFDLREHAPASIAHRYLASAGRPAACPARAWANLARVKQWFDSADDPPKSRRSLSPTTTRTRAAHLAWDTPTHAPGARRGDSPPPSSTVTSMWRTSSSSTARYPTPTGTPSEPASILAPTGLSDRTATTRCDS